MGAKVSKKVLSMYLAFLSSVYKYYLLRFIFCSDFIGFKPEKCIIRNGGTNEKYVCGRSNKTVQTTK